MPFLLLLFLTLACLPDHRPKPGWIDTASQSALLTWLGMGVAVAVAALISWRVRRQVTLGAGRRDGSFRRYGSLRLYHLLGLFSTYGLALYLFGWGWAVQTFCSPDPSGSVGPLVFLTEALILAPFLAALVLSWACFYDAERALNAAGDGASGSSFWNRGAYVGFHVRQNLALVVIPLLLLVLGKNLNRMFPSAKKEWQFALSLASPVLALGVFIGLPWLLRLVLGLRPLPDGPLRTRLMATAKRLRFRFSNILCWNTRGGVANAMVAGVLPFPRYVVLTDRLLSDLSPDELEAVFGHEIGHAKHGHMLYYLGFGLLSVAVLWNGVALLLPESTRARDDLVVVPLIGALGAYMFVVFGFLSRRCERQADIYGCRAVSCAQKDCLCHDESVELAAGGRGLCPTGIRIFIDALEKVAFLNGISRDRPGWLQSWQHSTIARRVDFLYRMLRDPSVEPRFQRRVVLVKLGMLLGLSACLAALVWVHG